MVSLDAHLEGFIEQGLSPVSCAAIITVGGRHTRVNTLNGVEIYFICMIPPLFPRPGWAEVVYLAVQEFNDFDLTVGATSGLGGR